MLRLRRFRHLRLSVYKHVTPTVFSRSRFVHGYKHYMPTTFSVVAISAQSSEEMGDFQRNLNVPTSLHQIENNHISETQRASRIASWLPQDLRETSLAHKGCGQEMG